MAIYHLNAKVISRGKGQSAIAAAAYRSGERLRDEQADEQKFYTSRAERIQFTDIMAPRDAPEWAHDRNRLWNEAERAEKRKDGQLAREIEVSLPHELSPKQREWLVRDFAREAFVRKGYAVDIAIHAPDKDSDGRNHHAHMMVTMRTLGPEGFAAKKDPDMNRREQLGQWREQWAHLTNRHLERHGHEARIDHRSLEARGIDREPTMHLGYAAAEIDRRGGQSDRADEQKRILVRNEVRAEIKTLDRDLKVLSAAERRQAAKVMTKPAASAEIIHAEHRPAQRHKTSNAVTSKAPAVPTEIIFAERRPAERRNARKTATRQAPEVPIEIIHAERRPPERHRGASKAATGQTPKGRPVEIIHAEHRTAERRQAAKVSTRQAAEVPIEVVQAKRRPPSSERLGREDGGERRDPKDAARQQAGSKRVEKDRTARGAKSSGLNVVAGVTGVVSKLGDFMVDFLARVPAPSPSLKDSRADMRAFVSDPAARKQQQITRIAAARQTQDENKALIRMHQDMEAGRSLRDADIKCLTRAHQEEIRNKGDDALRQMIDDARKRAENYWKGEERERDR